MSSGRARLRRGCAKSALKVRRFGPKYLQAACRPTKATSPKRARGILPTLARHRHSCRFESTHPITVPDEVHGSPGKRARHACRRPEASIVDPARRRRNCKRGDFRCHFLVTGRINAQDGNEETRAPACHAYGPRETDRKRTPRKARKHAVPQRRRLCHRLLGMFSRPQASFCNR